jgi:predicted metal-dependent hydrolase
MNYKNKDIPYSLSRSKRHTMSIYVEPDGKVTVKAPADAHIDKIRSIIEFKSYWIYKSIAELEDLNKSKVVRTIANGEGFLLLGRSHRLRIEKGLQKPLSLSDDLFILDEKYVSNAKKYFIKFYREQGMKHIPARVDLFKKKLGLDPKKVRVMELKNRWASRSRTGVNFHWKLMLAPISIIDYVIIHELAHFLHEGHSARFWEVVESVMPNYYDRKNWLRENGASLNI